MLTIEKFQSIFPKCKKTKEVVEALNSLFPKYDIITNDRICGYLSQCGHESGGFNIFTENLNYSVDGLLAVFPKYFTKETAKQYARKPEAIASKVYANRMGNGDEKSKDGWKYRGRGAIQLTGKNNYTSFSKDIGVSVDAIVEYCSTIRGALHSSLWYWKRNGLNELADKRDTVAMTKKINGGVNGLVDRLDLYTKAQKVM